MLNLVFIDTDCEIIRAAMNSSTSCQLLREREREVNNHVLLRRLDGKSKAEEEKQKEAGGRR